MTSKVKGKKGFTLIELLIVVVIIGILAAIAIPRFGETRERAYVSAMQSDLDQVTTQMEMYYQDSDFTYEGADFEEDLGATTDDNGNLGFTDGVDLTWETAPDAEGYHALATHEATDTECEYSNLSADEDQPYFQAIECNEDEGT